ncbi:hypothetical protein B481_2887 [Planococcus halocryophilus Or1]|uniref:Uncharacterized protein n=1 Tax=Planococcus halocryophilus TaxID=1215089 RepID=A0A1C7DU95_9BACL|nr:hypothetical protein [Planococcus halocryophilus]ANU14972.1 hypothetical protein BBI08_14405 [Planococcus halocryophilus]EMF45642.1 hypothetical protein B481_2887 [Planococcus halocryophilus Or1]
MKDFSFKARVIYFGAIAIISLSFLALQLTAVMQGSNGGGSITLVILWSIMALFGLAGIGYALKRRNRQKN